MRLVRHVARLVLETARFARTTRRGVLLAVVVLGLVLAAIALASATVAPVVLYPFG